MKTTQTKSFQLDIYRDMEKMGTSCITNYIVLISSFTRLHNRMQCPRTKFSLRTVDAKWRI